VTGRREFGGERLEGFGGPGGEHEPRALLGEHPCGFHADAGAGADEEDGLAVEKSGGHEVLPFRGSIRG
jgi:hypothetical protein